MKTIQQGYTLITGATSGIGKELAKIFANNGHDLVLVARTGDELEDISAQLMLSGVDVVTVPTDLFDPQAAFKLYDQLKERNIEISILVNDAGQGLYGLFEETDIHRELNIIQLNIASLVVLCKLFLPDMLLKGEGKILNLSSVASKIPGPWQSVYHGTKAFVQSFTEALRSEVKERGITVTALLPGATDTDFFNKAGMEDSKAVQDKDKLSDPVDVAQDGFDALMRGDDKVISGLKNKVQVAMSHLLPEEERADKIKKQQEPITEKK